MSGSVRQEREAGLEQLEKELKKIAIKSQLQLSDTLTIQLFLSPRRILSGRQSKAVVGLVC